MTGSALRVSSSVRAITLALLLATGCSQPPSATVNGKRIRIPPPAGMERLRTTNPKWDYVQLGRFAPDSMRSMRLMHYYAIASAPRSTNVDRGSARAFVLQRAHEQLGVQDSSTQREWTAALTAGLAGQAGPLPEIRAEFIRVERLTPTDEECSDVMVLKKGPILLGTSIAVAGDRAIELNIVLRDPTDVSDLARVHNALMAWVRAVREANP